jgi:hypothetical protein
MRLGRLPFGATVRHYISAEPVTFFRIVAAIEGGSSRAPEGWWVSRTMRELMVATAPGAAGVRSGVS